MKSSGYEIVVCFLSFCLAFQKKGNLIAKFLLFSFAAKYNFKGGIMALSPPTPLEVRARIHELSRSVHALDELFRVATVPCELLSPLYRWRARMFDTLLSCLRGLPSDLPAVDVLQEERII